MKKRVMMTLSALMIGTVLLTGCGSKKEETKAADTTAKTTEASEAADTSSTGGASGDITIVSREDGSGTRGAFIELLGIEEKDANGNKVDNTTEDAKITNSTSVMMTTVEGDVNAIGYISLGSLNETVTALKVDGAEATPENILSGTYKVVRPFNIATKSEISDAAKDFINFIMSKEGQAVVEENGYIPVGDAAAYTADTAASGNIVVGGSSSVSPVMEAIIEAYGEANPNVTVELQTTDSTTGVSSTVEGSYDIGMASREVKEDELAQGVVPTTIAQDGIAVIVNQENALTDLTSDQVMGIFTGEITDWADVSAE